MEPNLIFHDSWNRPADNALMDAMVFAVPGGILSELYVDGDRCQMIFSARPYVPGQS